MRKLLSAGFMRLRKAKIFWIVLLFMLGLGLLIVGMSLQNIIRYQEYTMFDEPLFAYVSCIGICCAVFCGSFLGTEYSDGTIRNKLVVGHKRRDIYLTNLMITYVAALIMMAVFLLVYCSLGSLVTKPTDMSMGAILWHLAVSPFTIAAFVSLFHMLAMLISNKAVSSVVCILFFFALLMAAIIIYSKLEAPEYVSGYALTVNGVEMTEPYLNPKYLRGMTREIYQFFFDLFPTGQSVQLAGRMVEHPIRLMLYSVGVVILTSISGLRAFSRKDLR